MSPLMSFGYIAIWKTDDIFIFKSDWDHFMSHILCPQMSIGNINFLKIDGIFDVLKVTGIVLCHTFYATRGQLEK